MLIVDAHIHIYDCFNLPLLFDSAYQNFSTAFTNAGTQGSFTGILMLAEKIEQNWFDTTVAKVEEKGALTMGVWSLSAADDHCSLKLTDQRDNQMYIVAGRQFNCIEGLEVLSLASTFTTKEELSLTDLIDTINTNGGIAVVPWAFGKWFGQRGEILKKELLTRPQRTFFLGDNGGRPVLMISSILSTYSNDPQFPVLPGSDPLPLKKDERRVGQNGFLAEGEITEENVSNTMKNILLQGAAEVEAYGKRMGLLSFFKNQIRIRK